MQRLTTVFQFFQEKCHVLFREDFSFSKLTQRLLRETSGGENFVARCKREGCRCGVEVLVELKRHPNAGVFLLLLFFSYTGKSSDTLLPADNPSTHPSTEAEASSSAPQHVALEAAPIVNTKGKPARREGAGSRENKRRKQRGYHAGKKAEGALRPLQTLVLPRAEAFNPRRPQDFCRS